ALQIAEQMSDYLLSGAISNAINFPSISAEEAPRLRPFVELAEQLGSFAGQLTETGLKAIRIEYAGEVAEMNTRALTSAALAGALRPLLSENVNMVSAPEVARQRGIAVEETRRGEEGAFNTYIRFTVETERQIRSVAGTVFSNGKPRIIQVKGIDMEAELTPNMLYITNQDKPGFIGCLGQLMGDEGVNIATFNLGRADAGGDAICLVAVDTPISDELIAKIKDLPMVVNAHRLAF
ncbi:MAG TPA: phosphoglycerate dehydrogenase, partial [Hyphomicrobiaceae bacterium]|nr:phosphoglycerate dehydrogenase [Hyphomicrobiaceae bacterium]